MRPTDSAVPVLTAMCRSAGGWWCAATPDDLLDLYTQSDDAYYTAHHRYVSEAGAPPFERARAAYLLGHLAGLDPEYQGLSWDEIEPTLSACWRDTTDVNWDEIAGFAATAFGRASAAKVDLWRVRLARSDSSWNAA
jgi:hypothetical protein